MRVVKIESGAGVIQSLEFQREAETPAAFKAAIWAWLQAAYPAITLADVFNKLEQSTPSAVKFNML